MRVRPAATVLAGMVAIGAMLLTIAALILARIAWRMTGAHDIFTDDPALLPQMAQVWGLFLASNIVREVLALTILVVVWTTWLGLSLRGGLGQLGLLLGTAGAAALAMSWRLAIRASARLSDGVAPHHAESAATLSGAGLAALGIGLALLAIEGRRSGTLPGWLRDVGVALALLGIVAGLHWLAAFAFAALSLVWWAGLLPALFANDRRRA